MCEPGEVELFESDNEQDCRKQNLLLSDLLAKHWNRYCITKIWRTPNAGEPNARSGWNACATPA